MKAILKFDLNDTDDVNKYKHCNKAIDYSIALWDISNISSHFKHHDTTPTYDEVLNYINEIFENNNININELN
jgi:hypothetical protein